MTRKTREEFITEVTANLPDNDVGSITAEVLRAILGNLADSALFVGEGEAASAYDLAVADGFVGTLADWLASLIAQVPDGIVTSDPTGIPGAFAIGSILGISDADYEALTQPQKEAATYLTFGA